MNIYQMKKKNYKKKVNFYFDREKKYKREEDLNVEKSQLL